MFPIIAKLLLTAMALMVASSLWKVFRLVWCHGRPYRSRLRHLRGPKSQSIFLGNLNEIINDEGGKLMDEWVQEYGETFRFKGLMNSNQLFTVDTRAINHILLHNNDYQKPPHMSDGLGEIFTDGLLVVEGAQHRQQRRIMNPAFGPAQVRALTETFLTKAHHLRDIWSSEIAKDPTATISGTRIDVVPWLNRLTLDIIGLTGFNHAFDSLDSDERTNKLSESFLTLFSAKENITLFDLLPAFIPGLHLIPTAQSRKIHDAKRTMMQVGQELLTKAKAAALASDAGKGEIKKNSLRGRDLLSLLVKANMATDIPESQRLSDRNVTAQVPTFLLAGHETTSTAVAWALYAMTQAPEVQKKLREELLSVNTDNPSMDELMALPYLDAVVRETLRVHAPVPVTFRTATKDAMLPVEKPYTDKYGIIRDTIAVSKGDELAIPILTMNKSRELWGPDAHEFKPERWKAVPEAVSRIPGVWGNLLTFIGGPRACIGYRFSLVETKAILFSLVRAFEFELAVPASNICSRTSITQRPVLRNDPKHQPQLPLLIKPIEKL